MPIVDKQGSVEDLPISISGFLFGLKGHSAFRSLPRASSCGGSRLTSEGREGTCQLLKTVVSPLRPLNPNDELDLTPLGQRTSTSCARIPSLQPRKDPRDLLTVTSYQYENTMNCDLSSVRAKQVDTFPSLDASHNEFVTNQPHTICLHHNSKREAGDVAMDETSSLVFSTPSCRQDNILTSNRLSPGTSTRSESVCYYPSLNERNEIPSKIMFPIF